MARRDDRRRDSSMRTLFEFRGQAWLVRGLLALALGVLAYLITGQVMK